MAASQQSAADDGGQNPGHGGARPGAGRKPMGLGKKSRYTRLPEELEQELQEIADAEGCTYVEALRRHLALGLAIRKQEETAMSA
jgi:hypothetical protein